MFKYIRALGVAGLTTIGSSQLTMGSQNVLWSQDRENTDVIVVGVKEAAQAIGRFNIHQPTIRFTSNGVGGTALVPLWHYEPGSRCSPNFDLAPFVAEKGNEVWANFEFVNILPDDKDLIAFAIKADKPGRKDRYRADHDIGVGRIGNKPAMNAMLAAPTEGDCGYYFLERGIMPADEIVQRNPGAAIRITISNHARGKEA